MCEQMTKWIKNKELLLINLLLIIWINMDGRREAERQNHEIDGVSELWLFSLLVQSIIRTTWQIKAGNSNRQAGLPLQE